MTVKLVHESGLTQEVPTGFSGTSFFFGILVPLCRGDFVTFAITLAVCVFTIGWGTPFVWLYLMFGYNTQYLKAQLEKGWKFVDYTDAAKVA